MLSSDLGFPSLGSAAFVPVSWFKSATSPSKLAREVASQYDTTRNTDRINVRTVETSAHCGESSEYFVTIANTAFVEHRVRYQDAPDICFHRLLRELATRTRHPPSSRFSVTDGELAEYNDAHTPTNSKPNAFAHKADDES
jgi:hypothetical protein